MKKLFAIEEKPRIQKSVVPSNPTVYVNGKPVRLMGNGLNALFMQWPKKGA